LSRSQLSSLASAASLSCRSGAPAASRPTKEDDMDLGPGHIELAGVVKSFDGFVNAVDGVNIKIPDGS
jgi:hypothetical protein